MATADGDLTVTKIDAARRQLETAASLYFKSGDEISIHTLAAAASGVLEPLARSAGKSTVLQESLFNHLSRKLEIALRDAINRPQNFFKHGGRDPKATFVFSPGLTELIMFDAMATYARVTGDRPMLLEAFAMWFAIHHADGFVSLGPHLQQSLAKGQVLFGKQSRREFLQYYLSQRAGHS